MWEWSEFLAYSDTVAQEVRSAEEDLNTIMYTSGTTGTPKGVMIQHKAMVSVVMGMCGTMKFFDVKSINRNDVFLSYLPLAHIFDRVLEELFCQVGGAIGYWRGDIKGLLTDLEALKPTCFIGVPRVYDRIYQVSTLR